MRDDALADGFGALSDAHRLRALRFIAERERSGGDEAVCACHLQEHLGLSQPATSYHMKVLREAGLVDADRRGRWVHYRLSSRGLQALRSFVRELHQLASAPEQGAA